MKEAKKEAVVYSPAYIHMDIYNNGEGKFSLDDKVGWAWYGTTDEFLLGLLRVGDSTQYNKFLEEIKREGITKDDIKTAIKKSLDKNPSDGLYHLLGDNGSYLGFNVPDEWSDIQYGLKRCLEREGVENAEDVADEIVFEASLHQPSTKEIFEEMENRLTWDMSYYTDKQGSWKKVVNDTIQYCDANYDDVDGFVDCINDKLLSLKEDLIQDFYNEYGQKAVNALHNLSNDTLKEKSVKMGVDVEQIKACISEI